MRKINIPESVQITTFNQETQAEEVIQFTFVDFLFNNALKHPSWGENVETLEQLLKLDSLLANCKEQLLVDDASWKKLNQIVNYPDKPYSTDIAKRLISFFRAIKNAESV